MMVMSHLLVSVTLQGMFSKEVTMDGIDRLLVAHFGRELDSDELRIWHSLRQLFRLVRGREVTGSEVVGILCAMEDSHDLKSAISKLGVFP